MEAENQKEQRANLIQKYYNGITNYEYYTDIVDGNGTISTGQPETYLLEACYKHINDLIVEHYDELKHMIGYVYDSIANLSPSETNDPPNIPPTNTWWQNADASRQQEEFFFTDISTISTYEYMRFNAKEIPYQRHPYILLNQKYSGLGSDDDVAWINTAPTTAYDSGNNPFETGSNFRMKEPLEYYGDENNLLWGKIIYDGRWVYRTEILKDSYSDHVNTGFTRLDSTLGDYGIDDIDAGAPETSPSPFEKMRYTYWGTGNGTTSEHTETIAGHSGTTSGSFYISCGVGAPDPLDDIGWYAVYDASATNEGWIIYIDSATYSGISPYQWNYTYTDAYWPTPGDGNLNTEREFIKNPTIVDTVKKGTSSDGRENIWSSVYSQYHEEFEARIDAISSLIPTIQSDLNDIIGYNYEVINEKTNLTDPGKSAANTMNTSWSSWLSNWKTAVGDPATGDWTENDSRWDDDDLDALITTHLNALIAFSGGAYDGAQSGDIPDRREEIYQLLGKHATNDTWYQLGSSESWKPTTNSAANENNSGTLYGSKLYYWKWYFVDQRLNRTSGSLSMAYHGYYDAYISAIRTTPDNEIQDLEDLMDNVITNAKTYDISPLNITISTTESDRIILEWDSVVSASSYRIEKKEGQNGSWNTFTTPYGNSSQYDYTDPGNPPNYDFLQNPRNILEDIAAYQGYQEFGLNFADPNATPPLNNNMTQYSFKVSVDGASAIEIVLIGADCQSWEALANIINKLAEEEGYGFSSTIENTDIRITSNTYGSSSSIALTAGTVGINLFTALSTTPDSAVAGITNLEEGKIYYYRIQVDNGWSASGDVTLGGGTINDKDWDSMSQWHCEEYSGDKTTHGETGAIFWNPPENVKVSGIHDNGVTPSSLHARIEWGASINASKYYIYRSTLRTSGYILIDNTTNTYYEDTNALPGLAYWYRITAVADSSEYEYYDDSNNLTIEYESEMSEITENSNGKRLWQTITLTVTTTDKEKVALNWNSLSGANGYVIYKAPAETSLFSYISQDDGNEYIETNTTFIDRYPAEQYLLDSFSSTSDGIADTDYTANTRYYLIVMVTAEDTYLPTIYQYYITSPASGTWTCQNIVNSLNIAFGNGLNNLTCKLVKLEHPHDGIFYRIKFTSNAKGERVTISITKGTFGTNWLDLFTDGLAKAASGTGALIGVPEYYKVKAVEIVAGRIVRESEYSNIVEGIRPVDLPT